MQGRDGESASYLELAELIETAGDPATIREDLEQFYRCTLFSVLIGNRDDYLRNHGFLRASGGWRLSPAFDINTNSDKDAPALAIDAADPRPISAHLRATSDFYRLKPTQLDRIDEDVRGAVRGWRQLAGEIGLNAADMALLGGVVDPAR